MRNEIKNEVHIILYEDEDFVRVLSADVFSTWESALEQFDEEYKFQCEQLGGACDEKGDSNFYSYIRDVEHHELGFVTKCGVVCEYKCEEIKTEVRKECEL